MQIVNRVTVQDGESVQVAWEVQDTQYPYMDIYVYTADEWVAETPANLEARQVAQYNTWRSYMENPNG